MRELLRYIEDNPGAVDEKALEMIRAAAIEKDNKYGLVWVDQQEPIIEAIDSGRHKLEEFEDKRLVNEDEVETSFLFEAENYQALKLLKDEKVKVDVIYIDPPYSAGAGIRYGDKLVEKNDAFKHSKWLSFMNRRLKLAKDVLDKEGVIFVSIDDEGFARLKFMMDGIFGEDNFIGSVVWYSETDGKEDEESLGQKHEYVLAYANSSETKLNKRPQDLLKFKIEDEKDPYTLHTSDVPKPKELIQWLIGLHPKKDALVLDFFAGSGITAQAVMELNQEDGGNRRFILATNNEIQDEVVVDMWLKEGKEIEGLEYTPKGAVRKNKKNREIIKKFIESKEYKEYHQSDDVQQKGICREVTYERIRSVSEGDFAAGAKEPIPINMRYYKLSNNAEPSMQIFIMKEEVEQKVIGLMMRKNLAYKEMIVDETHLLEGRNERCVFGNELFIGKEGFKKLHAAGIMPKDVYSSAGLDVEYEIILKDLK